MTQTQSRPWIDEIVEALEELGGGGTLNEIYAKILERKRVDLKSRPNWQSTVRRTILVYSSDANIFHTTRKGKGKEKEYDVLYAPKGLHAGYWAIRKEYRKARAKETKREKTSLADQKPSIKIFYGHAPEDEPLQNELEKHLSFLRRQGHITTWDDQDISAGTEWEPQTEAQLSSATIILLLISSDFINSEHCYRIMEKALKRHNSGQAFVIPILLRPVHSRGLPISHLPALPTNGQPIVLWPNRDEAFSDIAGGIEQAVFKLIAERWLDRGDKNYEQGLYEDALAAYKNADEFDASSSKVQISIAKALYDLGNYLDALDACERAITLDFRSAEKYRMKGNILGKLGQYEDALTAYTQAIQLDPLLDSIYIDQGVILMHLRRYEDALTAYEQALKIASSTKLDAYQGKADALYKLDCYEEALAAYEKVINTCPTCIKAYQGKADALCRLNRYEEALTAYKCVISHDRNYSPAYRGKGDAFCSLDHYKEALVAYEKAISLDPFNASAYRGKGKVFQCLASKAIREADILDNCNEK